VPGTTKASATFSPLIKSEAFFGGSGEPAFQIWIVASFSVFVCERDSAWKEGAESDVKGRREEKRRGGEKKRGRRERTKERKQKSSSLSL
jgi:hypothetical protein